MEPYCVRCKRYTKNVNAKFSNTINGKTMTLSKCATCGGKKLSEVNIKWFRF